MVYGKGTSPRFQPYTCFIFVVCLSAIRLAAMGQSVVISDHLKFLLAICKDLKSSEVEDMKFLCQEHIPCGTLEAVDALGLVKLLHHTGLVQEGELHFLQDLFVQVGRTDLARKVDGFRTEKNWPNSNIIGGSLEPVATSNTTTTTTRTRTATAIRVLQDKRGKHRVEMVKDLGADIFEQLGFFLNPRAMRNWVTLAGKLGYTHAQAMNFKLEPTQSTQLLLHDWSTASPDATVQNLHYKLKVSLRRPDAAEVLEPFLGRTKKETLIL